MNIKQYHNNTEHTIIKKITFIQKLFKRTDINTHYGT